MKTKQVLSFQEITGVKSIDDLMELYASRVPTFARDDFVPLLRRDWEWALDLILNKVDETPAPDSLPHLTATVNKAQYRAFGVEHSSFSKREPYATIVQETIRRARNLVFEQRLGSKYIRNSRTEMADRYPPPFSVNFGSGFDIGFDLPSMILEFLKSISTDYSNQRTNLNVDLTKVPLEFVIHDLPAYVEISLRQRAGKQLNWSQFRSAYMAAFMRFYSPTGGDALVGANHSAEVQYFLSKGIPNQRLAETAHYHAELMRADPEKLNWYRDIGILKHAFQGQFGVDFGIVCSLLPRNPTKPLY